MHTHNIVIKKLVDIDNIILKPSWLLNKNNNNNTNTTKNNKQIQNIKKNNYYCDYSNSFSYYNEITEYIRNTATNINQIYNNNMTLIEYCNFIKPKIKPYNYVIPPRPIEKKIKVDNEEIDMENKNGKHKKNGKNVINNKSDDSDFSDNDTTFIDYKSINKKKFI
jgi:hypothetical protein